MSTFYSGRVPGDLLNVPNENVETWLKDPMLIRIFMEIVPQIGACIIVFIALTVITIGLTLLGKTLKLMYARRARKKIKRKQFRMKRLLKSNSTIVPADGGTDSDKSYLGRGASGVQDGHGRITESNQSLLNALPTSPQIPGQHLQNIEYKNWLAQQIRNESGSVQNDKGTLPNGVKDDEDDNDVGILTGTKRKKTHHYGHHKKTVDHKHKKYFWVRKLFSRVNDHLNVTNNKPR